MFHSCASNFLEVAMDHANPYTVCTNETSYSRYQRMTLFYNLLITTVDPKNNNVTCSEEYLNKNQQSVITTILKTSTQIWNSANCDDCYNSPFTDGKQNFSDHTLEIKSIHENYSQCTLKYDNASDICHYCEHVYLGLNTMFDRKKKERDGKICFDLEDIVRIEKKSLILN